MWGGGWRRILIFSVLTLSYRKWDMKGEDFFKIKSDLVQPLANTTSLLYATLPPFQLSPPQQLQWKCKMYDVAQASRNLGQFACVGTLHRGMRANVWFTFPPTTHVILIPCVNSTVLYKSDRQKAIRPHYAFRQAGHLNSGLLAKHEMQKETVSIVVLTYSNLF